MSENEVREFQKKLEALCDSYKIPFFFSVTLYRNEQNQIRAMQMKECSTDELTVVLVGTAAHNAALHAMETVGRGKILSEEERTTYKPKHKPENNGQGKSN